MASLIEKISNDNIIRKDILEKDYYVTLILEELSAKQDLIKAYFKGGTALYKALRSINRFSEDIDLTVEISDCSTPSQAKKRLVQSTKRYKSLRYKGTLQDQRYSITSIYDYDSLFIPEYNDTLQRFGNVKIEATSFTISEPVETREISPYLYELATDEDKKILQDEFDVKTFCIKTITIQRIFVDKIFASEFYYKRSMFVDMAKHLYDITILMQLPIVISLLDNKNKMTKLVAMKRAEEERRAGGIDKGLKIKDFSIFDDLLKDSKMRDEFYSMQSIYVFSDKAFISCEEVTKALCILHEYVTKMGF